MLVQRIDSTDKNANKYDKKYQNFGTYPLDYSNDNFVSPYENPKLFNVSKKVAD